MSAGKCTSNDLECYFTVDYWNDMNAKAEGPLVKVIEHLELGKTNLINVMDVATFLAVSFFIVFFCVCIIYSII